MPGTSIPGRLAKLEVSDNGGTSYINFGGIVDITLNLSIDELETTSHDSTGVREYIPNFRDFSMDCSARWQDGDPGQGIVLDAVDSATSLLFKFYMEVAANRKIWTGSLFATTASPSGPLDDTGALDLTFRCSGVQRSVQT